MSDTQEYVYVLTVGTHDDVEILGIYRTVAAAKRAAEEHFLHPVPWVAEDESGARSLWDSRHEPYGVGRWPLEGDDA